MAFSDQALRKVRPDSVLGGVVLPRQQQYYPSPVDWRDECLYFLLVDRFSDGTEDQRRLLDRTAIPAARGQNWRWDAWADSGQNHWQGGTLRGVTSKLDYLKRLGVTALWLSPVFKQRGHEDTYHGYAVQDFLDVDPHFGTRADLVELVSEAHRRGLRILLDIIFHHSGFNWLYPPGTPGGEEMPVYTTGRYPFGSWRGADGQPIDAVRTGEEGAWPVELQDADHYTRAGMGDLGAGAIDDPMAEHKRTDFFTLRDFELSAAHHLTDLAACYKYWIALTDCDGFRIDTLKHVSFERARNFCGTVKEYAANLGKMNFFLVGEIAGGDVNEVRYLDVLARNLNAALDIGEMRLALNGVAKGLVDPTAYFQGFDPGVAVMGSHRNLANHHVSILDDHDHVFGVKTRFTADAAGNHQVAAGVALQVFTLGIPCIYYGTEQAFAGPEPSERHWLPDWGSADRYLREAMFGPHFPRLHGRAGLPATTPEQDGPMDGLLDTSVPGFGPFGTAGEHCFDEAHPAFVRISAMMALRKALPVLRDGRQYLRTTAFLGRPFGVYGPGEILAWSRILDDEEAVCVVNTHGTEARGADVLVDASLNRVGSLMTVVLNTAQSANPTGDTGVFGVGAELPIRRAADGSVYIEIRDVPPSEVLVLTNHPIADTGEIRG